MKLLFTTIAIFFITLAHAGETLQLQTKRMIIGNKYR